MQIDRRKFLGAAAAGLIPTPALARGRGAVIWTFDSLKRIGGLKPHVEGDPKLIRTPLGKAVWFDGVDDALFLDRHPLAGAARFTFEALFRPDGGGFEQRWFHLESDAGPGMPATGTRTLFEVRVKDGEWWLDTYVRGDGYAQPLIDPEKRFPLGRWYHVAQTYDGETYRAFVNGALQAEAKVAFKPQGPGKASVGIRINRVSPFRGAVRQAAFLAGEARTPSHFLLPRPR